MRSWRRWPFARNPGVAWCGPASSCSSTSNCGFGVVCRPEFARCNSQQPTQTMDERVSQKHWRGHLQGVIGVVVRIRKAGPSSRCMIGSPALGTKGEATASVSVVQPVHKARLQRRLALACESSCASHRPSFCTSLIHSSLTQLLARHGVSKIG
jgi:hypothetical protein